LIARGCVIEGQVERSVIFPGVVVKNGAVVRDSIVMQDTVVGEECRVEYSIIDKLCRLDSGAVVGTGSDATANREFPGHLDCGISVVGKGGVIPAGVRVGKNCILCPGVDLSRHGVRTVGDGETMRP
jgi:glucose-1-phosphate adenylyltransferase